MQVAAIAVRSVRPSVSAACDSGTGGGCMTMRTGYLLCDHGLRSGVAERKVACIPLGCLRSRSVYAEWNRPPSHRPNSARESAPKPKTSGSERCAAISVFPAVSVAPSAAKVATGFF